MKEVGQKMEVRKDVLEMMARGVGNRLLCFFTLVYRFVGIFINVFILYDGNQFYVVLQLFFNVFTWF